MYVGRIVSVGRSEDGRWCAAYRVSSRSFPNRTAVVGELKVSIVPKAGYETDIQKNPYIAYNCVRIVCNGGVAVVTNGSQTDPIAEKIAAGMPPRDALALSLLALDYEKDHLNTPRICAVADRRGAGAGWLAVVRHDGMQVEQMDVSPGMFFYVATYEENRVTNAQGGSYRAMSAEDACGEILGRGIFAERENPVTAVAAFEHGSGFALAALDAGSA
ncbi:MAG: IMP cyclohydrolase [Candidatus Hydrogenedentes bacterium]|nr:IMP cyclohydrolase [Candidatus Hydrogenedentota bacterium]